MRLNDLITDVLPPSMSAFMHACSPTLDWKPCNDTSLGPDALQCAFLQVPLDYDKPNGRSIHISVARYITACIGLYGTLRTVLALVGGSSLSGTYIHTYGLHTTGGAVLSLDFTVRRLLRVVTECYTIRRVQQLPRRQLIMTMSYFEL